MITATPAQSPSMLSIRLNAFVTPAIHRKVTVTLNQFHGVA